MKPNSCGRELNNHQKADLAITHHYPYHRQKLRTNIIDFVKMITVQPMFLKKHKSKELIKHCNDNKPVFQPLQLKVQQRNGAIMKRQSDPEQELRKKREQTQQKNTENVVMERSIRPL